MNRKIIGARLSCSGKRLLSSPSGRFACKELCSQKKNTFSFGSLFAYSYLCTDKPKQPTIMAQKRKYPVGIQSFESLRMDGYVYVDKTPLIYKMITEGKPYFLSRPRRFGKSLLVNTLAAVFEGRRDLFEAFTTKQGIEQPQLFIARTDWEWEKYPVLRFDFSKDLLGIGQLDLLIDKMLERYEQQYGITPATPDTFLRMDTLVRKAHEDTGKRVVLLVDEYDKMMLHSIGDEEMAADVKARFKNLFSPLMDLDEHLQFVF